MLTRFRGGPRSLRDQRTLTACRGGIGGGTGTGGGVYVTTPTTATPTTATPTTAAAATATTATTGRGRLCRGFTTGPRTKARASTRTRASISNSCQPFGSHLLCS